MVEKYEEGNSQLPEGEPPSHFSGGEPALCLFCCEILAS